MKKLLIPLFVVVTLAFVGTACEQHSAAELQAAKAKHGKHDKAEGAGEATEKHAPFTPESIPQNPAGSNPVGTYDAANPNPAESGNPPKFFPKK
jgi:hypothetical protein